MVSVAKNKDDLKKRLLRFFGNKSKRTKVSNFMDDLSSKANIYVYGGLIRDIALFGVASFNSDIDLVFIGEQADIAELLNNNGAKRNKFGGFRLEVGDWEIDIWEASKTWAFEKGYRDYAGITSLLKTTITNWDSILFDWNNKKLICDEDYFTNLEDGYLDVIFEENPNEIGMYVRLIRYFATKDAHVLSSKAAFMIKDAVGKFTYSDLSGYERQSYGKTYISNSIYKYLKNNENISNPELFPVALEKFHQTKALL